MRRRRSVAGAVASEPVLVGAVTVLVVIVAVFLAYNANNGLPFVPTKQVEVDLPDADRLVAGNEVRVGGQRVGVVKQLTPMVDAAGRVTARARLLLEPGAAHLGPRTQVRVRARSPLGLKYLEIVPEPGGATLDRIDRRRQARSVELDDVLDTFDATTRSATQHLFEDLGVGFASRGEDLNLALSELPDAARGVARVARALAAPSTDLDGLIVGLADIARTFAPVSGSLRRTFEHLDTTLAAIAAERGALDQTLQQLPRTEVIATRAFTTAAPVLGRAAHLAHALRTATPLIRTAARRLADATTDAPADLRATLPFAGELRRTFGDLRGLARRPSTLGAVRRLTPVVTELRGLLPDVMPFQTTCNYLGLWMRNVNSATSEGDRNGHWFRFGTVAPVEEMVQQPRPASNLHSNPYPIMRGDDCEAGNEPYLPGQRIGNLAGDQGPTEMTSRPTGVHGP
jgi:ABC-type transporter Mla subunit MlaD